MSRTILRGKDWITTQEWSREELETVLSLSQDLKIKFASGISHEYLRGKTNYLIFYNPSLRTRNSFETGMTQLGGHANYLSPSSMYSPGTNEMENPVELVKETKEDQKQEDQTKEDPKKEEQKEEEPPEKEDKPEKN